MMISPSRTYRPGMNSSSGKYRRSGRPVRDCSSTSPSSTSSGGSAKLSLVAYSTPKEAYAEIIPSFDKTAAGKGVTFTQSYGASGDQSRAVASGLPADVVAFSLSSDVNRLVKSGLVSADWNAGPDKGI